MLTRVVWSLERIEPTTRRGPLQVCDVHLLVNLEGCPGMKASKASNQAVDKL